MLALYLDGNQLTSVPAELGNLSSLKVLDLSGNHLISVPAELGQLAALVTLNLSENQLTGVPAALGQLATLSELYLSDNQLSSVPASLGNLSSLTDMYLEGNLLTRVPAELGNLAALKHLHLTGNPKLTSLHAELYHQFSTLNNVVHLDKSLVTLIAAAHRFAEAAESGDDKGQVLLAQCYLQGRGVERDPELAASWFRKSADQGNAIGH